MPDAITATRPARGERLDPRSRVPGLWRQGRRAAGRLRGLRRPAALPGDRVTAEVTKAKRGFAEARDDRALRPSARSRPARCDHAGEPCPGAPWQGLAYEHQLRPQAVTRWRTRCVRLGGLDGFELESIEPAVEQWRYRNKLEYSFGERDGELVLGFHARGRWDEIVDVEDCLLASEREQRPPQRGPGLGPLRRGSPPTTSAAQDGRTAQPGRPRGHDARGSSRPASSPPPPRSRSPRWTSTRSSTGPGSGHRRADRRARRRVPRARSSVRLRFGSPTAPSSRPTPRWPSASTASRPRFAGLNGPSGSSISTAASAPSGSRLAARAGEVWGVEIVADAIVDAERERPAERHRATPTSSPATPARRSGRCWSEAGKPDVVVVDPPRAGLSQEGRSPPDRVRGAADRLRLLQSRRRSHPTPPSSPRPAIGCGG